MKLFKKILWGILIFIIILATTILAHYFFHKRYEGPVTDHFDGRKFYHKEKNFTIPDVIKWGWTREPKKWPEWIENKMYPKPVSRVAKGQLKVTFINHASTLLQFDSLNVLTDPIWSERASPVSFSGPKRVRKPGIELENLPPVDIIIISHNHYDHLDLWTLKEVQKRFDPVIYVGLGVKAFLEDEGFHNVKELDWWQKDSVTFKNTTISIVPSRHNSQRGIDDGDETLWGGYVLTTSKGPIYFAGDTGYGKFLEEIHKRYEEFRLGLIPVGAYEARWFMYTHHMNPEDAVKAHKLLNIRQSIGIHFGTFNDLTDEGYNDPQTALMKALKTYSVDTREFQMLDFGESRMVE
jgi:L-ascorbate metabolism protein UlaG (beta-lactamase superfamily)